ncbi:protein TolR [Marilutibacter alkalisoli]|uniref:Tol-Pal system protein TolR n=1 Tax=Marilutibacter alkalisoli TaxID=2591633 RepID=A0A514BU78_9GAMM|nr:protein TolR [Lysobacter alkalisoli]QDH70897.1 protein TolR [Lysobacter alkalisoli]
MAGIAARRLRKRKLKAEINVVPYIDVMLVLLIIFMVTAPLLNLGVDIELPRSNAKSMQEKKDPIVVSVDVDGNYFLTVEAGSNEALAPNALQAKMAAIVAENPQVPVFVAGDGTTSYQKVMDAMALLQNAGVERVGLMSQPQDGR